MKIDKKVMKIIVKDENISIASANESEELTNAHEQFRLLVEYTPIAMVLVNKEGIITLVNNKAENVFEYSRKEIVGQKLNILIPERYHHQHPKMVESYFKEFNPRSMGHKDSELFGRKKNGKEIAVEIGLNPIKTQKGEMVLASIIDVTERKLHENDIINRNIELTFQNNEKEKRATELTIAYKELRQAEKYQEEYIIALKEMMFITSHKLRVPITNIIGMSEILDQSVQSPEKIRKIIDFIKKSAIILDDFSKELAVSMEDLENQVKGQELDS